MKTLLSVFALVLISAVSFTSCKSSSDAPKSFCDTASCLNDTLRFTSEHKLSPYIYITAANCKPGSIIRSHKAMGGSLKTDFGFSDVKVNKDYIRCLFNDTSYAYILFNDCITGRGYQVKLPFSKTGTISKRSSGINSMDPKFSVAENMIAYVDRGNIFVEDMVSGKKAMMTFGKAIEIDYDVLHESVDSVNVTNQRIWVKVKMDNGWKEIEKKITLE
jgi:hypothetical protein